MSKLISEDIGYNGLAHSSFLGPGEYINQAVEGLGLTHIGVLAEGLLEPEQCVLLPKEKGCWEVPSAQDAWNQSLSFQRFCGIYYLSCQNRRQQRKQIKE